MVVNEEWFRGSLHELSREDCLELLAGKVVGRVCYVDDDGPVVIPVNYVVDQGGVLFRTSPQGLMAAHVRDGPVAFQVDEVDEVTESGWSVLLRGEAAFEQPKAAGWDNGPRPSPWAQGSRNLLVRITPRVITGRRLLPG